MARRGVTEPEGMQLVRSKAPCSSRKVTQGDGIAFDERPASTCVEPGSVGLALRLLARWAARQHQRLNAQQADAPDRFQKYSVCTLWRARDRVEKG